MSKYLKAIIWIDRGEAKVFQVVAHEHSEAVVYSHTSALRLHHQASHEEGTNQAMDVDFFRRVIGTLNHIGATLLLGPGNSKFEFKSYLDQHRPELAAREVGVETLDNSSTAVIRVPGARIRVPRDSWHDRLRQSLHQ